MPNNLIWSFFESVDADRDETSPLLNASKESMLIQYYYNKRTFLLINITLGYEFSICFAYRN